MASKHSTGNKKPCKPIVSKYKVKHLISQRSEWSHWMQGADPEWFHSDAAKALGQTFGDKHPLWLIQSEPWRLVGPERFNAMRKLIMQLTIDQCAAYLRVHRSTVSRWEAGEAEVPFAAYEALRLQSETNMYKMSHHVWDGWFINRQTGALVSPDNGKISVLPNELNTLQLTYGRLSSLELKCSEQAQRIDKLEADNTALRGGQKVRDVAAELTDMQDKIADLLQSIQTAEIHHFPIASYPARATAGA